MESTSILEVEYAPPTRPYSKDELTDMKNNLYRALRLADEVAEHPKCSHYYRVKQNSKKQTEIANNCEFIGNCSVCWKISKTPRNLKSHAMEVVDLFNRSLNTGVLSYDTVDIENVYYRWIYLS
jgi:hypothetical protein